MNLTPSTVKSFTVQELVIRGKTAIEVAGSFDEVKEIADQAKALHTYQRSIGASIEAQNAASEIRYRAERRMGVELQNTELSSGIPGPGRGHEGEKAGLTAKPAFILPPTLSEIGITKNESYRYQNLAKIPEETFEAVVEAHRQADEPLTAASIARTVDALEGLPDEIARETLIARGEAEILAHARRIKNEHREARQQARALEIQTLAENIPEAAERYRFIQASCSQALEELEENSIDWIITDPPYPYEYVSTYTDLAKLTAKVLKPGGLLLAMSGQSYLPEIVKRLSEYLTYHWTIAYWTPGSNNQQQFTRKVNVFWKPIFVYSKQSIYQGAWFSDLVRSESGDKQHHHWGQSISGMTALMEKFVKPGDLVLDPFMGAGTTGIVALNLGASFIGYDTDQKAITSAKARIASEIK